MGFALAVHDSQSLGVLVTNCEEFKDRARIVGFEKFS